jgi:hypothetical protein
MDDKKVVSIFDYYVPHRLMWDNLSGEADISIETLRKNLEKPLKGYNMIWNEYFKEKDKVTLGHDTYLEFEDDN